MPDGRRILVISRDGARKRDWSRELAREGQQVVRCAARDCPLVRGESCDVLAQATAAIYDEDAVSPDLFLALVRTRARPTVIFARDMPFDGRHHPRFTRVLDRADARPHLS